VRLIIIQLTAVLEILVISIQNTVDPDWIKSFAIDLELGLHFTVSIFHKQRNGDGQLLGNATFEISEILGSKGCTKEKRDEKGMIVYARVDKCKDSGTFTFKLGRTALTSVGASKRDDLFFEISRRDEGEKGTEWNTVYRSEHIMNNLNPTWNEDTVESSDLCLGDLDTPLRISVLDYEKRGRVCSATLFLIVYSCLISMIAYI
jgi:Ca2+-dependent lipid-binding protein